MIVETIPAAVLRTGIPLQPTNQQAPCRRATLPSSCLCRPPGPVARRGERADSKPPHDRGTARESVPGLPGSGGICHGSTPLSLSPGGLGAGSHGGLPDTLGRRSTPGTTTSSPVAGPARPDSPGMRWGSGAAGASACGNGWADLATGAGCSGPAAGSCPAWAGAYGGLRTIAASDTPSSTLSKTRVNEMAPAADAVLTAGHRVLAGRVQACAYDLPLERVAVSVGPDRARGALPGAPSGWRRPDGRHTTPLTLAPARTPRHLYDPRQPWTRHT